MAKSVLRCILISAFLVVILGVATKGFAAATLSDAYNVLIGNGWTAKDALGFLGTSIAGTLAMNPGLAPAAAAGALSAYIAVKGTQLYDIYGQWRNIRSGIAVLNPIEYSQSMAVKRLANGEYGWTRIYFSFRYKDSGKYEWSLNYRERRNYNGILEAPSSYSDGYLSTKDHIIGQINYWLSGGAWPPIQDSEGRAMLYAMLRTAYNYVVAGVAYNVEHTREVVADLVGGSTSVNPVTLGYRVNVDPASISEDGVQYLEDPDAFYQWFVTNYMNGTNEGTFVTPTIEAYDEIRTQLETIIDQLNNLSSTGGGVSEDTLNQLKTDILNAINSVSSKVGGLETTLDSLGATLTSVANSINNVDTTLDSLAGDITEVKSAVDALTTEIDEAQEEEQGFWDRLMDWLNETLFVKLKELLQELFIPDEAVLDGILAIDLPEYQKSFAGDISFSAQSVSIGIQAFGARVDLSGKIREYADGLRDFMNMFVCGLAAVFVIGAFRVHFNID